MGTEESYLCDMGLNCIEVAERGLEKDRKAFQQESIHDTSSHVTFEVGIGEEADEPLDGKSSGESDAISSIVFDNYFHDLYNFRVSMS